MRKIGLIGAPLCDGERELGVEKAPGALRKAGLVETLKHSADVHDFGDLPLRTPKPDVFSGKLRNIDHIVGSCRQIMLTVKNVTSKGYFPVVVGGDCSLFPGALAGLSSAGGPVGAIYFDGHSDFHTPETTLSGSFSGMCLAASVGKGPDAITHLGEKAPIIPEENVFLLGVRERNIEPGEWDNLRNSRVNSITLDKLRREGFEQSIAEIARSLPPRLYLHFDLDVINQKEMPALAGITYGVHTEGGLTFAEVAGLYKLLSKLPIECMDVTLYDPNLDGEGVYAGKVIEVLKGFFEDSAE